ncbi:uncharacterized protein [Cardiocondyla obscurior]|uniref:uncharacterized protein n=1 Tax=Cardiocondyla obscurior TaxID=286306 RepID=UPI003965897E
MHTGANLLPNIMDVLIWIRRHRHVFATDITKMYRQIQVHPDDWDLQHEGRSFPLAVPSITNGRYVDDIFGGADTINELTAVAQDVLGLCNAGRFPLAKWHATDNQLLSNISILNSKAKDSMVSLDNCETKLLGLKWMPHKDQFIFSSKFDSPPNQFTKRLVLSKVAQIFDPLGFVSPVVIRAKVFMQKLWLLKLSWDDLLPASVNSRWLLLRTQLNSLASISIPRWLNTWSESAVELHGFADASQLTMGAVIYLTVSSPSSEKSSALVCSKTKVASLKKLTIPRLELTAALMLTKLVSHITATLKLKVGATHLWTDSQVTLTWIKSQASRWKDYVRNKVAQIQELGPTVTWHHVPGTMNPADCASRGVITEQLKDHPLWWTGPQWLTQDYNSWPSQPELSSSAGSSEARLATQATYFAHELKLLTRGSHLPAAHAFSRLTAFIDDSGVVRVGRRFDKAPLSYKERHPAILPRNSQLSAFIIDQAHKVTLHGGTQLTLSKIRQNYWIIGGRAPVKAHILRCVPCARQRGVRAQQLLAVHLEVVTDYATDGFLAAYRRFSLRRGTAQVLYSDCGTNFIGADMALKKLFKDSSQEHKNLIQNLSKESTLWRFNSPASPHMEKPCSHLKSMQYCWLKSRQFSIFDHWNRTVMIQMMYQRSRRDTFLSAPLSMQCQSHHCFIFLHQDCHDGSSFNNEFSISGPSGHLIICRDNKQYQNGIIHQTFVKVGSLVLLTDERLPPSRWPLARVLELHPETDGLTRIVTIKTATTTLTRPIVKLAPLPDRS